MRYVRLTSAMNDHVCVVNLDQVDAMVMGEDFVTVVALTSGKQIPVRESPEEIVRLPVEEMEPLATE